MLYLRKLPDQTQGLLAAMVVVICWSGFNIVSRFGARERRFGGVVGA